MIEGSLSDVSLPGLLQFLATESNKSYKVSLVSGGQKGDLHVCDGEILSANFGLLEGNDALTELLFWPDGTFSVDLLNAEQKAAIKGNLKIILKQANTFADQMVYLREAQVGLNSEIVPSLSFGTQEWQEALARQPLFKEDYAVLGWITDGRTMRQAMREFNFDVVKATSSLFRLLSTGSVEILRPTLVAEEDAGGEIPMSGLAAILDSMAPSDDGAEGSTSSGATFDASPTSASPAPDMEAPTKSSVPSKSKPKAESKSEAKPEPAPETKSTPVIEPAPVASSRLVNDVQETKSNDVGTATGATFTAVSGTMELSEVAATDAPLPAPAPAEPAPAIASSSLASVTRDFDVITSDSLPAVGSKEFEDILAKAQKASEEPQNPDPAQQQAVTAQIHLPTSFRTSSDKLKVVSSGLTNDVPIAKAAAMARQTIDMDTSALAVADSSSAANPFITAGDGEPAAASVATAPLPIKDSSSAWAAAVRDEPKPQTSAPAEDNAERRLFDIVRTDPLPIVAIDIERLFQTAFHVSPYGHVSLGNDVLDSDLQKILQDFKQGKNFITVATEEQMQPAQVLHHCKFCLERGYIDPPDAVASLTADLLLGRVELEQYLLQRRRITGDELRDVMEVSRQKGIKLTDLLVKLGFMTASDWDRLCQEKERFARR